MKLFHFYRGEDQTGVSGTGPVVEGVEFTNGWCALRWISNTSSMCFYQSIEEVKRVHGHGGKTEIIIHDFEPLNRKESPETTANMELLLELIEEVTRVSNLSEDPEATKEQARKSISRAKALLFQLEDNLIQKTRKAS